MEIDKNLISLYNIQIQKKNQQKQKVISKIHTTYDYVLGSNNNSDIHTHTHIHSPYNCLYYNA